MALANISLRSAKRSARLLYPFEPFGTWTESGRQLHHVGQFVSSVRMVEEHPVTCSGERTVIERRGLRLDVGVQDGHDARGLRQAKVVLLHSLDRALERLKYPRHDGRVTPVLVRDVNVHAEAIISDRHNTAFVLPGGRHHAEPRIPARDAARWDLPWILFREPPLRRINFK